MQGLKFILHKFIFACIDGVTDKFAVHINRIRSTTVQVGIYIVKYYQKLYFDPEDCERRLY